MKHVRFYLFKNKVLTYLVKHRKKVRTVKALAAIVLFSYLKYHMNYDVDALFIALSIWYIKQINWR